MSRKENESFSLNGMELERAACGLFRSLFGTVKEGPAGGVDFTLSFPDSFPAQDMSGRTIFAKSARVFAVEVKSHENRGALLNDLRQLADWTDRLVEQLVPISDRSNSIQTFERTNRQARRDLQDVAAGCSAVPSDVALQALNSIAEAASTTIRLLSFRAKGVLVINHRFKKPRAQRGKPIYKLKTLDYAHDHRLVVLPWPDLLEIRDQVLAKKVDPLDFYCQLFDQDGCFRFDPNYDWRSGCVFLRRLFASEGMGQLGIVGGPEFLQLPGDTTQGGTTQSVAS